MAKTLLIETGVWSQFTDEENNVNYLDAPGYLTDIIGLIYKPSGAMLTDKDGMDYPEMIDVGGWHVNMRGEVPPSIKSYVITVSGTPYRIWD